jgi:hypothetical protein
LRRAPAVASIPAIRRRRGDDARRTPREKTSLSIRADVLEAARAIVQAGEAANLSALVESALSEKIRRSRRASLYAAYEAAARDSDFMRDMQDVTRAFRNVDNDGL